MGTSLSFQQFPTFHNSGRMSFHRKTHMNRNLNHNSWRHMGYSLRHKERSNKS